MSLDPAKIGKAVPRTVEIDGIGPVVVRRPRLADVALSNHTPYWWAACCRIRAGRFRSGRGRWGRCGMRRWR